MKKIAIVVQRYGLEVNGGAEYHARILAEKLSLTYDVTILTTTAIDYHGWENHYAVGTEIINQIPVKRFKTYKVSAKKMRKARRAIHQRKKYFKILKVLGLFEKLNEIFSITQVSKSDIENWIKGQGPYCPDLIKYIINNKSKFDTFIFFTYLYYPTVVGMPKVSHKSIFIPTAHDEPLLYTLPYKELFHIPKFIMYNTLSEKKLIESTFKNYSVQSDIAGVGINSYHKNFRMKHDEAENKDEYFVYIGRIDEAKGCRELINFFIKFNQKTTKFSNLKLILIGKNSLKNSPAHSSIIYKGFISEDEKFRYLQNAKALIIPSLYESLSLVTLEAMAEGIPVIANRNCEVLKDHIIKSGTGKTYSNYEEFSEALSYYILISADQKIIESQNAKNYVIENYSWDSVMLKFDKAIQGISELNEN